MMANRIQYTREQIITKLREAEILFSQSQTVKQVCKAIEISEQTYYRWRKEYGDEYPIGDCGANFSFSVCWTLFMNGPNTGGNSLSSPEC